MVAKCEKVDFLADRLAASIYSRMAARRIVIGKVDAQAVALGIIADLGLEQVGWHLPGIFRPTSALPPFEVERHGYEPVYRLRVVPPGSKGESNGSH